MGGGWRGGGRYVVNCHKIYPIELYVLYIIVEVLENAFDRGMNLENLRASFGDIAS